MRISLSVTQGPHQGRIFEFSGHDMFLVGRSRRAHFQLARNDRYFSRVHFMVEVNPPSCKLLDMGSRNGTYVNGVRVSSVDLHNSDEIRAGKTVLKVDVAPMESTSTNEATPSATSLPSEPQSAPALTPSTESFVDISSRVTLGRPVSPTDGRIPAEICPACGSFFDGRTTPWPVCSRCVTRFEARDQPIPGYQIIQQLGGGGMGMVYLALREATRSIVALKTITPAASGSKSQIQRFLREAEILRELEHRYIVAFHELGEAKGQLFFAMDYVRGVDGSQLLKEQGGPLPIGRAVELACQLLEALEYAHAKQFVHRDIKPGNMLVTQVQGKDWIKLADFGLARVYQASQLSGLTMMDDFGGTLAFIAPEQITSFREARPPVDQYAAGASLYNLLTDKFVYDLPQRAQDRLLKILHDEVVPIQSRRPELPQRLAAVIHRSLAREPADRFSGVREMRLALEDFRSEPGSCVRARAPA